MQSFPMYEIVRAVERDLDHRHAELARNQQAGARKSDFFAFRFTTIAWFTAAVEWWFRPGESTQA